MKRILYKVESKFLFFPAVLLLIYSFVQYRYYPVSEINEQIKINIAEIAQTESEIQMDKTYLKNELNVNLDSIPAHKVFNGNIEDELELKIRDLIYSINFKTEEIVNLKSKITTNSDEAKLSSISRMMTLSIGLLFLMLGLQFFIFKRSKQNDKSKYEIIEARDEIEKLLYHLTQNKLTGNKKDAWNKRTNMEQNIVQLNKLHDRINEFVIGFKHPIEERLIDSLDELNNLSDSLRPDSEDEKIRAGEKEWATINQIRRLLTSIKSQLNAIIRNEN